MYIDSHAHLFDEKIDLSIVNLDNVDRVLVPTYKMEHLDFVRKFCEANPKFYLAVGVHPEYIDSFEEGVFCQFVQKHRSKIYAIGEIGVDSGYPNLSRQIEVLRVQFEVAKVNNLPVSVHLRGDVFEQFFAVMKDFGIACVLHCFSGSEQNLTQAIERGYYISFATNLTYKGNVNLRKLAGLVPDDRLLIETDSPSMAPSGFPRGSVNTSENISFVADCLATVRGVTATHIAKITSQNANNLFFKGKK